MDAEERAAAARAAGAAVAEVATAAEGVHRVVLARVRRALDAAPAGRAVTGAPMTAVEASTAAAYRAVRLGARAGGDLAAVVARSTADEARSPWSHTPGGARAVAWVGAAVGDHLAADVGTAALAPAATVRADGRPVSGPALRQAFPRATGTVVVLLHGLAGHERQWPPELLEALGESGGVPVAVRYTSGLPVAENGRALDAVLDDLVHHWPVEVTGIVVVGHSMGGLVARSAMAQSAPGSRWVGHVTDLVTLGTPHAGAPLERWSHRGLQLLRRWEAVAPLAALGHRRAGGIKDLRFGALLPEHWGGRHPDDVGGHPRDDPSTVVPLPPGVRHVAVVATLPGDPHGVAAAVLGDGMVPPRSAAGRADDPAAPVVVALGAVGHLSLQRDPRVIDLVAEVARVSRG